MKLCDRRLASGKAAPSVKSPGLMGSEWRFLAPSWMGTPEGCRIPRGAPRDAGPPNQYVNPTSPWPVVKCPVTPATRHLTDRDRGAKVLGADTLSPRLLTPHEPIVEEAMLELGRSADGGRESCRRAVFAGCRAVPENRDPEEAAAVDPGAAIGSSTS